MVRKDKLKFSHKNVHEPHLSTRLNLPGAEVTRTGLAEVTCMGAGCEVMKGEG